MLVKLRKKPVEVFNSKLYESIDYAVVVYIDNNSAKVEDDVFEGGHGGEGN